MAAAERRDGKDCQALTRCLSPAGLRLKGASQVAQHSLLFKWSGHHFNLNPVLFVSHIDVVPATEGHQSDWSSGPFSGDVTEK